jgi:dihydrofolate reductase/thymidylate synthase
MAPIVSVIVATTPKGGIGKDGALPWRLPGDMAYFKRVTLAVADDSKQNAVIMGRKTWESIPEKFRPLPGRLNVVLTKAAADPKFASPYPEGVLVAASVAEAVKALEARKDVAEIFVIGGQAAYQEALGMSELQRIFLTRVGKDLECDAFFPAFDDAIFKPVHVSTTSTHKELAYDFVVYERVASERAASKEATTAAGEEDAPAAKVARKEASSHVYTFSAPLVAAGDRKFLHEEYQYLDAIRKIIDEGVHMGDRTGTGTRSVFGMQQRYDLRNGSFPLLTTKRVFWRGVLEELLWFVKGSTNGKLLSEKGVKIWDGNGSKEFLEKRGLGHREEGDLGPVYGFQWRHFGAKYVDMHTDYTGQGVDQLAECIKTIKENPTDRRILLSAWNPADLDQMALPPCHMFCQFYVANGELSCLMYQRSCDMGLGVPFNIASYSLLTLMMAQVCGLKPGEFVHTLGNAHVYQNHVEPLQTQLDRTPRPFPILKVNPDIKDIDGFQAKDFELIGYSPHGKIAMEMAV